MKKTFHFRLMWLGIFAVVLSGCLQSTPESPQEAVEEQAAQMSLTGTAWDVESFGEVGEEIPIIPDTRLSVNYLVGRYLGSSGCNWYLGVYGTDGSNLRMETPARTRLICEPVEVMEQEGTFMSAILNVTEYKMDGDKLMAFTVENQRLLTLVPASPTPFEGTTWDLKLIFDGEGLQPTLPGASITARFEGDELTGSAGCNDYSATVDREGETLTINSVESGDNECADPEHVMDQETAYLSTLPSVTVFNVVGHTLALLDADGQPLLIFGAE